MQAGPGWPAQLSFGLAEVSHGDHVKDELSTGTTKGLNQFQHGVPPSAAEIELEQLISARQQRIQGSQEPFRQVDDMNVIPRATAIGRGPIAAEHLQTLALADSHLAHEGEQVVRNAIGVFANKAART